MPEVIFASVVAVIVFIALSSFIGVAPGNMGIYGNGRSSCAEKFWHRAGQRLGLRHLGSFGVYLDPALLRSCLQADTLPDGRQDNIAIINHLNFAFRISSKEKSFAPYLLMPVYKL